MKTDDRDERLASILDDAVRDIGVSREAPVAKSHVLGRAGRAVAAVAAVAIFVGAVVFAASQFERDAGRSPTSGSRRMFASPDFPWTFPIPDGWAVGAARSIGGPRSMVTDLRTSFVSTSTVARSAGLLRVESSLPSGIVDSDVIVVVDPFGGSVPGPTTPVFNAVRTDRENPGWTWRDARVCGATGCARVYVWHGPDAGQADLAQGMNAAAGVQMVDSQPDPSVLVPTIDYRDGADRFTTRYPVGWTVADEVLTPQANGTLSHEILSVGTFPLEPGGRALSPFDSLLPGKAIADVGPEDVLVTVEERTYPGASTFPPRPSPFDRATVCGYAEDSICVGDDLGLDDVRTWWLPFSDPGSGRSFYALIAMGEKAYRDPARSAAAWAILESLRFPRTLTPDEAEELPPAVRGFHSEFVSDERGYRVWPTSGQVEPGIVYRFEVPHCGMDWLVDFDGSFWEPTYPAGDVPGYSVNADIGTMELVGPDEARYVASDGSRVSLSRIDGPVMTHLCE
jgi:hypothetical protein